MARAQTGADGRDPQLVAGIRARALGGILQLQAAKIRKALPLRLDPEKLSRICRRSGARGLRSAENGGSAANGSKANDREIVPAAAIASRASKNGARVAIIRR